MIPLKHLFVTDNDWNFNDILGYQDIIQIFYRYIFTSL